MAPSDTCEGPPEGPERRSLRQATQAKTATKPHVAFQAGRADSPMVRRVHMPAAGPWGRQEDKRASGGLTAYTDGRPWQNVGMTFRLHSATLNFVWAFLYARAAALQLEPTRKLILPCHALGSGLKSTLCLSTRTCNLAKGTPRTHVGCWVPAAAARRRHRATLAMRWRASSNHAFLQRDDAATDLLALLPKQIDSWSLNHNAPRSS